MADLRVRMFPMKWVTARGQVITYILILKKGDLEVKKEFYSMEELEYYLKFVRSYRDR